MIGAGDGVGVGDAHPSPARDDWLTFTQDEELLVGSALAPPRSDNGVCPSSSLTALSGLDELSAPVPPPVEPSPVDVLSCVWRVASDVLDANRDPRFNSPSEVVMLAAARPNPPVEDWEDEDIVLVFLRRNNEPSRS